MGKAKPYYERFITGPLLRFDDRNSGFSRLQRNEIPLPDAEKAKTLDPNRTIKDQVLNWDPQGRQKRGYGQADYALKFAGRTIDRLIRQTLYTEPMDSSVHQVKFEVSDKPAVTKLIKEVAQWFGADLVGICEVNHSWTYSHWGDFNAFHADGRANPGEPIDPPNWVKYAIVMGIEMDYENIARSPAVESATDLGYSKMAFIAPSVASYIRLLGYHAMPMGNEYALNIPLAIDAGLGELGRHGLLITKEFGPRVRICKVFTDLPLETDAPIDIGVQHFCENCGRCADACPGKAIPSGDRTDKAWDMSNNVNVLKWPVKVMPCLQWWLRNRAGCSVCIRVCPFNKPKGPLHSAVKKTIKTTSLLDNLLIKSDEVFGYGKQKL